MAWRHRSGTDPWSRAPLTLALEPRIMFDAAGAATYVDVQGSAQHGSDPWESDHTVESTESLAREHRRGEIVFIDSAVANHQLLVTAWLDEIEVVVLTADKPALEQIANHLYGRSDISGVHVVSHGGEGFLAFGSGIVGSDHLADFADELQRIRSALVEGADILLYGCFVGQDNAGREFLDLLAALTGADVAASVDLTGPESWAGNWILELSTGTISTETLVPTADMIEAVGALSITGGTVTFGAWTGDVLLAPLSQNPSVTNIFGTGLTFSALGVGGTDRFQITNERITPVADAADDQHVSITSGGSITSVMQSFSFSSTNGSGFNLLTIGELLSEAAGTTTWSVAGGRHGVQVTTPFELTLPAFTEISVDFSSRPGFNNVDTVIFTQVGSAAIGAIAIDTLTFGIANTPPALAGTVPANLTILDTATATPFSALSFTDAENNGGTITIAFTAANGTLSGTGLTGSAGAYTLSGANPTELTNRLQALVFTPTQNQVAPGSTVQTTFTLTPNDGTVNGTAITAQVTATSVNDPPVLGGLPGTPVAVNDTATISPFTGATIADPDTGQTITVTVSLDDAAKGTLAGGGFAHQGNGVYTFSAASAPVAQAALRALVFTPAANRVAPGLTETTTFSVTVSDGTAQASGSAQVVATGINDAPTLTNGATVALTGTDENTASGATLVSAILTGAGYADPDPGTLSGIAVTATSGNGNWQFSVDGGANWTNFGTVSGGSALLLGSDAQVRFAPDGILGGAAGFTFRAWDQTSGTASATSDPRFADTSTNGGTTAFSTQTASVSMPVTDINDPLTVAATGTNPTFTEGGAAVALFSGVTISTVEPGQTIVGLTLTVSGLADGAAERLLIGGAALALTNGTNIAIPGGGTASVSVTGSTATVTLTGLARSPADAQTLVQGIAYENTSDNPTVAGGRTVTLTTIRDSGGTANGGADTNTVSIASALTLVAVNDSPSLGTTLFALSATDERTTTAATAVSVVTTGLGFADPDGPGRGIMVIGSSGLGTWQFSLDSGTSWTAFGTVSPGNALLLTDAAQIRYVPNGTQGETATLTLRGWDVSSGVAGDRVDGTAFGGATPFSAQSGTVTLDVAAINDAPVLAGTVGGTFTETVLNAGAGASGSSVFLVSSDATVTDPDQPANFNGATLTVSFAGYQTGDRISFAATFGPYTYNAGTGQIASGGTHVASVAGGVDGALVVTFTGAATNAVVTDVLRNVLYFHVGDDPTAAGTATTRAVSVVFNDGGNTGTGGALSSNTLTGTLSIVALNDPEGFAGTIAPTFAEGAGPVILAPGATVTRVDAANFVGGSLTVSLGSFLGGDAVSIVETGGITVSGGVVSFENAVIGTVVGGVGVDLVVSFVEPAATHAAVQALVRAIAFQNTTGNPTDFGAAPTRAVTMILDDGGNTGAAGSATSTLTGTITIAAVNDAPTVTPSAGNTAFVPGGGAVVVDPGLVLADVDSQQLNQAVISISPRPNGMSEQLVVFEPAFGFGTAAGLTFMNDSATGIFTISGTASLAVYQEVLRAVTYNNTSGTPDTSARTISFTVRDTGGVESTAATRDIIVNNPPSVAIGTLPSVAEGASVVLTSAMVTASDVETTNPAQLVFTITAASNGVVRLDGNALAVGGTFTQADVNGGRISYLHDGSETFSGGFSFVVRDADNVASSAQTLAFTIDPVNDAPTITLTGALTVREDVSTALTGIVFADPDAGSGSVVVTFEVARGTLTASSAAGVTVAGSGTGTITLTGTIPDLNVFVANSNVFFLTVPNDDQNVQLTVTIDDQGNTGSGGALTATATITIAVTPVNDAPIVTGIPVEPGPIEAGTGPASVTPLVAVSVIDVDTPVLDGGRIVIAQTSGTANGTFSRGGSGFSAGDTVLVGGVAIGTVAAGSDGAGGNALRIDLGPGATLARVEAFLRALDYDAPTGVGNRGFLLTLVDGAGVANGGADTATAVFTIAVTPSTPVVAGLTGAFTYLEKSGPVLLGTAVPGAVLVTDLDSPNFAGGELRIAITGGTAGEDRLAFLETGGVSISGGVVSVGGVAIGTVTGGTGGADLVVALGSEANAARVTLLLSALAYENTNQANPVEGARTLTVTLRDAAPGPDARTSAPAQILLTVQGVNDAPVIGGIDPAPQAIGDNGNVQPFAGATIVDADGAGVTLTTIVTIAQPAQGTFAPASLGGFVDQGGGVFRFVGTQADAQAALRGLVFVPAENRVAPGSTETTSLVVSVSDGIAAPVTASATIVVTSINDAPTFDNLPNFQVLNDKSTLAPFAGAMIADPDAGQPITVTVTIDRPDQGGFTAASLAASGFAATGVAGVFAVVAPDAATAQAALRALVFQPVENRIPPGTTELTIFTVSVSDGVAPAIERVGSVVVTSINDAPVLGGLPPGQSVAHDGTLQPFAGMLVADPDTGQTLSVRIGLTNPGTGSLTAASLAAAGFVEIAPGLYERSGFADPAAAAAALRGLVFQPIANAVAPGSTASVAITVTVSDGTASTASTSTVTIAGPRLDAPIPVPAPPPVAPPPPPAPPPVAPPPIIFVPGPPIGGPASGPVQGPTLGTGLAPVLVNDGGGPVAAPSLSPISATSGFFLATSDGPSLGIAIRASAPVGDFVLRSGGGSASFTLPPATFVVESAGAQVLVGALLADGSPLPAWVQFDPATGTFRVDVPPGFTGTLDIVLTATLATGESATTGFSIEVDARSEPGAPPDAPPQREGAAPAPEPVRFVAEGGKPAFSDAVKAASRGAFATHAQTLLDDLIVSLPGERPSGEIEADSRNGRDAA